MIVFLIAELRQKDPMLDLSLFKRPAMVGVSIASFAIAASIFAMFLYQTLYLQDVLGYGPLAAGLRFLPITVLAFVAAPIAGKLTVRFHSRYLMGLGLLLVAIGCFLMAHTAADSTWTVLLPGFIVAGLGIGIANPVMASASVAVVPPERSGMASGSANTFRQVGIATGIAGLGAVYQSQILSKTLGTLGQTATGRQVVAGGGTQLHQAITEGGVRGAATHVPPDVGNTLLHAYQVGFTSTFNHLMIISTFVALAGSAAAFGLIRQRDFVLNQSPGRAGPAPGPEVEASEPAVVPAS
jgi:MFS family permease